MKFWIIASLSLCFLECHTQDQEACSYWYYLLPRTNWCNAEGVALPFLCGVFVSRDLPTPVRWYWTPSRAQAGVNGTQITADPSKYLLSTSTSADSVMDGIFVDLYYDQYQLSVVNFNESDNGYYWCQITLNETSILLPPEPSYAAVNSSLPACPDPANILSYVTIVDSGVCAELPLLSSSVSTIMPSTMLMSQSTAVLDTSAMTSTPQTQEASDTLQLRPTSHTEQTLQTEEALQPSYTEQASSSSPLNTRQIANQIIPSVTSSRLLVSATPSLPSRDGGSGGDVTVYVVGTGAAVTVSVLGVVVTIVVLVWKEKRRRKKIHPKYKAKDDPHDKTKLEESVQ